MTHSTDRTAHYKTARVIALNADIEEDAMLLIDEALINCFITYCPYEIEIGKTYNVELSLNLSDSYKISRIESYELLFEKIGKGYAYFLYGKLQNENFFSFTPFNDQDIHYDHPQLNGNLIKLEVERIDASFH